MASQITTINSATEETLKTYTFMTNDEARDAMRIANDSRYGLGGGIFCRDEDRARRLAAEEFDTGMISLNGFNIAIPNTVRGREEFGPRTRAWQLWHEGVRQRQVDLCDGSRREVIAHYAPRFRRNRGTAKGLA